MAAWMSRSRKTRKPAFFSASIRRATASSNRFFGLSSNPYPFSYLMGAGWCPAAVSIALKRGLIVLDLILALRLFDHA